MTKYSSLCDKIFLHLLQNISVSVTNHFCLCNKIFRPLCDKIFLPKLTLRFVGTFVVRISAAFLDQLSNKFRSHFICCRGTLVSVNIFVFACFFQNRIFEMQFFHLCEQPCQSKKILYLEGKWKDGRKIKSHLRQFLFKFWAASPLVWWPAEHQVHLMANSYLMAAERQQLHRAQLPRAASPCIKALSPLGSTYFPSKASKKQFFLYLRFFLSRQLIQINQSINN